MDITQRYISAYIVECLTGEPGNMPGYAGMVAKVRKLTGIKMLDDVVKLVKNHNPRDPLVVARVRKLVLKRRKNVR